MSEILLIQLEERLQEVVEKREHLREQESNASKLASEIRKEIIELDGAEKLIIEIRDSVRQIKDN